MARSLFPLGERMLPRTAKKKVTLAITSPGIRSSLRSPRFFCGVNDRGDTGGGGYCGASNSWAQIVDMPPLLETLRAKKSVAGKLARGPHRSQRIDRVRTVHLAALMYEVGHPPNENRITTADESECGLQWTRFHEVRRGSTPASGWLHRLIRRIGVEL